MRVLITGGTGLLGQALILTADGRDQLCILHQRDYTTGLAGIQPVVLDILNFQALTDLFEAQAYDVVIHAAGMASVDAVERNFGEAWRSNVVGTRHIIDLVTKKKGRLVYISSNAVFNGKAAPYQEGDLTNPVNRYGQIKVECESLVKKTCPDALIVRPILMYGWHMPQGRPNPVTWLLDRLAKKQPTHLVTDVYENPLWSQQCAEAIWRMLRLGKSGMFHLAGKDIVNRYEFAKQVARAFDLDASLLHPVDSSFFPNMAPRPHNTSFVTARMRNELEVEPLSLADGLQRMRATATGANPACRP